MALTNEGKSDEEVSTAMKETVLAYDNMCHLNSLRASRKDLPLPPPFDKMWQSVGKVIDRLHLRNHKDPSCKINYDPDKVLPENLNTMAAEQVNVWASRLKRIMVAMPYVHHMFFFHRMVKKRNSYTEFCYKVGKDPVLPKNAKRWAKLK
ncbi:Hypothetical predicted protein [Paramuricea clavata]|uniref:Uncharacterized protein n=1 Tax=Paramuricea clavata TaxID=317549 RepID=A0A7D9L281_PARCT|nr:Hypothetical predicted protein [Paramuricea clavata]